MPKTTFVSGSRTITYARRDTAIAWLVNRLLRLASTDYRATIAGAVNLGLQAAAQQVQEPDHWQDLRDAVTELVAFDIDADFLSDYVDSFARLEIRDLAARRAEGGADA